MQRGAVVGRCSSGGESEGEDDALALLMRESSRRQAAVRVERERAEPRRWRQLLAALAFLAQVLLELGRRALAGARRGAPRLLALLDRCLVALLRLVVRPLGGKRVGALQVLLAAALALALTYLAVSARRIGFGLTSGRGASLHAEELTEERIRPHILVERVGPTVTTRRQQLLREGGDGLKVDDTVVRCENTAQGPHVVTDSKGYVCTRRQLDKARPGCCNETDATLPRISRFTCEACDTEPPHCCDVFEHCVSCCMHPLNTNTRREFLSHADPSHPVYGDPTALTVFEYCQFRCRSSSASVQHQNSYRSRRMFCYGVHRPLKVLPTVNSDGLVEPLRSDHAADAEEDDTLYTLDQQQPQEQQLELELDPFYLAP